MNARFIVNKEVRFSMQFQFIAARVLYFGLEYLIWLYVALKATSAFK